MFGIRHANSAAHIPMLGTEYNWLITHDSRSAGQAPARTNNGSLLTLAVAVFCFLCVALLAG